MASKSVLIIQTIFPVPGNRPRLGLAVDPWDKATLRTGDDSKFQARSSANARQSARRIAIVDDDKDVAEAISMMVKRSGCISEYVARDGDEIVRAVLDERIHPQLILIDHRMAGLNGMQVAEVISKNKPEIKIVIESADDGVKQNVISRGWHFLQKPFSMPAFEKTVHDALG